MSLRDKNIVKSYIVFKTSVDFIVTQKCHGKVPKNNCVV